MILKCRMVKTKKWEEPPKAVPAPDRTDQMSFLEHLEELR